MSSKYTAQTIVNYSPRKSRQVVKVLKSMSVGEAMSQLRLMDKGKSKLFYKLLKNAVNNLGLEEGEYDTYYVKDMLAEEAQKYYRVKPRARGAAFRIRRRYSRVKVLLDKKLN